MPEQTPNPELPDVQRYVSYLDLSGGLNTRRDPHALARNQLAVSQNIWLDTATAISKRPGNTPAITVSGAVGTGVHGVNMSVARFPVSSAASELSTLVVQSNANIFATVTTATGWTTIGTTAANALPIQTAQLFDPAANNNALFIVDGVDVPRYWTGPPSTSLVNATAPVKQGGSGTITPRLVSTLFSSLFYSGEPSEPTAVYVSDPFQPESFTQNALIPVGNIATGSTYIPYLIGRNDGVNGGNVTGLMPLGGSMIVYKEAAIYQMEQIGLLGEMAWGVYLLSASVGLLSTRSLAAFDTWHCGLGIDGVYAFGFGINPKDGSNTWRISDNVPTFFDGPNAAILDRTTAVGVRYGQKYLIFYDDGMGTGGPLGYPTTGMFFDFNKKDSDGLPCAGQIIGMNVNGVAPLRGPLDTGNFAWCDGAMDRVGLFGIFGTGDFGGPISVTGFGKADFMSDVFGEMGPLMDKVIDNVQLLLSVPQTTQGAVLNFQVPVALDQLILNPSFTSSFPVTGAVTGAVVGTAIVGTAIVGANLSPQTQYQRAQAFLQAPNVLSPAMGAIVQVGFSESSIYPWTMLGYSVFLAPHLPKAYTNW